MSDIARFKKTIWDYYSKNKRGMPWREDITPYKIVVSEIMLQQTQVTRIIPKFNEFIKALPDFRSLSQVKLPKLLILWSGIGYNRRAIYLQKIAQIITEKYNGVLPADPLLIDEFPGIGPATAASIIVYAYNKPIPFIETNIRRIFIHHFFSDLQNISDNQIFPLVKKTLDINNPREWNYALMDYGSMLAKIVENPNRKSKHYVKQSKFEGSNRQIRGGILKYIIVNGSQPSASLFKLFTQEERRVEQVIEDLVKEGFLVRDENRLKIK